MLCELGQERLLFISTNLFPVVINTDHKPQQRAVTVTCHQQNHGCLLITAQQSGGPHLKALHSNLRSLLALPLKLCLTIDRAPGVSWHKFTEAILQYAGHYFNLTGSLRSHKEPIYCLRQWFSTWPWGLYYPSAKLSRVHSKRSSLIRFLPSCQGLRATEEAYRPRHFCVLYISVSWLTLTSGFIDINNQ